MQYRKEERKKRRWPIVLAIVLVLAIALGIAGFFLLGQNSVPGSHAGAPKGEPATAFFAEGDINALTLEHGGTDEESMRAYFATAVEYAASNGYNTIIYEGKTGLSVLWQDAYFPKSALVEGESLFHKVDPLALLLEEAEGSGMQVWLAIDAFAANGYTEDMKGEAAKLTAARGGSAYARFDASDEEYAALLASSLSVLPHYYGVAGIVLEGLDATSTDAAAWNDGFMALVQGVQAAWQQNGYATNLVLDINSGASFVSAKTITELYSAGNIHYALVTPNANAEGGLAAEIELWSHTAPCVLHVEPGSEDAERIVFTASATGGFKGNALLRYPTGAGSEAALRLLSAADMAFGEVPTGFTLPKTLMLTNPAESTSTTFESFYLMGLSNPDEALYIDGEEIERISQNGAFGTLVALEMGENTFTFTQGGTTQSITITRRAPATGGIVGHDSTQEATPGQVVQVNETIISALSDPDNNGSISETFPRGARLIVRDTKLTTRGSYTTWAYQITSGDWVLASQVEWVNGYSAGFTGLAAQSHEKGEYIVFEGAGTPASYVHYNAEKGCLILTMYDTSFTLPEGFTSEFVRSASLQEGTNFVELTLYLEPFWGYNLEYAEGGTRLFISRAPMLSDIPGKPLDGVHILLDAGHGDTDNGLSAGIIGFDSELGGPYEKHINLALAQSIAYRLRQLGAEVTMIRDNDSFTTVYERLAQENAQKPDMYLSIHHNALDPNRDLDEISGPEVFYYHPYSVPQSQALAENVFQGIIDTTGRYDARGVKWGAYVVARTTVCPSVLVEYGFMGNAAEFEDITSTDGIYSAALGTVDGILATLGDTGRNIPNGIDPG